MSNYIDHNGQYHLMAVKYPGHVPTNDSLIMTAYAHKLGLPVPDLSAYWISLEKGVNQGHQFPIERTQGKPIPYPSRDFFLGAAYFNLVLCFEMENSGWGFSPFILPRFSLVKTIQQLILVKGKHRNYFWENNLTHLYRFAFSVPLADRAFIYRCSREKAPLIYRLIEWGDNKLFKGENNSSKMIRWLKGYSELDPKVIYERFPEGHPFRGII